MEEHDSTGLVGVPVRFNYTPLKFIGTPALNIANGEYIISVKLQNVNNACKIFVALINGKGVSGFGEANIKEGQTEASVSVSAESAQTAKIFIWNSLGGMTPLCKPKIISVTQGI